MKTCVIFCAADFDRLEEPIGNEDVVIAADGGYRYMEPLGLTPHAVLGDFDSLGYVPEGAEIFPVQKDDTDAMLAVIQGLRMGCRRFILYGSLDGPRLDHTVANFQTLQYLCDHGAFGYLVGKDYLITVLKEGALKFPETARGTISLFCSGAHAEGVNLQGLYYSLENGILGPGFPLGVSNHFTGKSAAEISVEQGSLLIMWDRKVGLPERT